ncbi:hypothetical protein [Tsuneonella sp. HG222]
MDPHLIIVGSISLLIGIAVLLAPSDDPSGDGCDGLEIAPGFAGGVGDAGGEGRVGHDILTSAREAQDHER